MDTTAYIVELKVLRTDLVFELRDREKRAKDSLYITQDVHFLPKTIREKLHEFDKKIVSDFINSSVSTLKEEDEKLLKDGIDSKNLPPFVLSPEQYDGFIDRYNNQYKQEYEQLKNEIISEYDRKTKDFIAGLGDMFVVDKNYILHHIPSQKEFEESFKVVIEKSNWDMKNDERVLRNFKNGVKFHIK